MALTPATWYLGPVGDYRALLAPKVDLTDTTDRYGGVHQALSGARVMDITGYRQTYQFDWDYMSPEDWEWMNALYLMHIPGPHRLLNPMKKNKLSSLSTSLIASRSDQLGAVIQSMNYQYVLDFPVAAGVGNRSLLLTSNPLANSSIHFDGDNFNPVPPTESFTCSIWMKAASAQTVNLFADAKMADGTSPGSASIACSVTTAWQRFSVTHAPGAHLGRLGLTFPNVATYNVQIAAPQLEYGTSPTTWRIGGGGPTVLLDSLSTSSHRFPLTDVSLSMLEA